MLDEFSKLVLGVECMKMASMLLQRPAPWVFGTESNRLYVRASALYIFSLDGCEAARVRTSTVTLRR